PIHGGGASGLASPWLHACLADTALAFMTSAQASDPVSEQSLQTALQEPADVSASQTDALPVDAAMVAHVASEHADQSAASSDLVTHPPDAIRTHADHSGDLPITPAP